MFKIFELDFANNYLILKIFGIKISFKIKVLEKIEKYNEKLYEKINIALNNLNCEKQNHVEYLKRITPSPQLQFSVDIVDHCNLNCKGCDHFCPISDEKFLSLENYEKDLKQLSKLCANGQLIKLVCLEGGEPLLHPEIIKFMEMTRKYCPQAEINLMTNAILLPRMNKDFYLACNQYDITIAITKYPLKIDFETIHNLAEENGARICYFNDFDKRDKTSWKIPFDLTGKQDATTNFLGCYMANNCITLRNGRLYTCSSRAYADKFNKYFNQNLPLSKFDEISIYDAESYEELSNFLSRPISFCKYCDVKNRKDLGNFEISKKDLSEWV